MTYKNTTPVLRWIYGLTLLSMMLPAGLMGVSAAVGLTFGGGMFFGRSILSIVVGAALLYRLVQVIRFPRALDVNSKGKVVTVLRSAGVALMCFGLSSALLMLLIKPLTLMIFHHAGDNGIGYFVVGVFLYALTGLGWVGVAAFEFSRLLGKRQENSGKNGVESH